MSESSSQSRFVPEEELRRGDGEVVVDDVVEHAIEADPRVFGVDAGVELGPALPHHGAHVHEPGAGGGHLLDVILVVIGPLQHLHGALLGADYGLGDDA